MTHEEKVACQRIVAGVNATAQASIAVCKRLANAAEARAKQAERERDEARRQADALEAELVRYVESLNGALADVKRLSEALERIAGSEPNVIEGGAIGYVMMSPDGEESGIQWEDPLGLIADIMHRARAALNPQPATQENPHGRS